VGCSTTLLLPPISGVLAEELSTAIAMAVRITGVGNQCRRDQILQFTTVKKDSAAPDAQVHHDAVSRASLHVSIAMRA
jgi:hypothetical protein